MVPYRDHPSDTSAYPIPGPDVYVIRCPDPVREWRTDMSVLGPIIAGWGERPLLSQHDTGWNCP